MPDQLTIQFLGICAFVKKPGGKILVVLPDATGTPPVKGLKRHRAFIRWERKDIDSLASSLKANEKESNKKYGVAVLRNDTVRIGGPIASKDLVVNESFVKQIPPMEELATSRARTSAGGRASITLQKGVLEAEPVERGHRWVFKPYGDTKVGEGDARGSQEFANTVLLKVAIDKGSRKPLRIDTGRGSLIVSDSAPGVVQITIGNLEGKLLPVKRASRRRAQDVDFIHQYEIALKPPSVKERLIPTRVSKRGTRGANVECFAARWGDIKTGIQS